jgi:hypothetical protein
MILFYHEDDHTPTLGDRAGRYLYIYIYRERETRYLTLWVQNIILHPARLAHYPVHPTRTARSTRLRASTRAAPGDVKECASIVIFCYHPERSTSPRAATGDVKKCMRHKISFQERRVKLSLAR